MTTMGVKGYDVLGIICDEKCHKPGVEKNEFEIETGAKHEHVAV